MQQHCVEFQVLNRFIGCLNSYSNSKIWLPKNTWLWCAICNLYIFNLIKRNCILIIIIVTVFSKKKMCLEDGTSTKCTERTAHEFLWIKIFHCGASPVDRIDELFGKYENFFFDRQKNETRFLTQYTFVCVFYCTVTVDCITFLAFNFYLND